MDAIQPGRRGATWRAAWCQCGLKAERRMSNRENNSRAPQRPRRVNWFIGIVFGAALILALRALAMTADVNALIYNIGAAGWGKLAEVIVRNKINALWHAAFMAACAGVFVLLMFSRAFKNSAARVFLPWLLVAMVAGDAFYLSRHYVKAMPLKAFDENDVIRVLKSDQEYRRVALVSQEGFYNSWLTYLFPYHGIKAINVTQMPRMPTDYKQFFNAVGMNPLRLWQLSAVGFVLAPAQLWGQFQKDPVFKEAFELMFAYNVRPAVWEGKPMPTAVEVVPATAAQPGQHIVMRLLKPAPRFALIGAWEVADDAVTLQRLAAPDYVPFERVLVAPGQSLEKPGAAANPGGQVQVLEYRPGRIKLKTSSVAPAVLRAADKYDPDWRALVDGRKSEVLRVDFIFMGVYLEPGVHEVLLEYAPARWPLLVQALGFLIFAGALLALLRPKNNIESAGSGSVRN